MKQVFQHDSFIYYRIERISYCMLQSCKKIINTSEEIRSSFCTVKCAERYSMKILQNNINSTAKKPCTWSHTKKVFHWALYRLLITADNCRFARMNEDCVMLIRNVNICCKMKLNIKLNSNGAKMSIGQTLIKLLMTEKKKMATKIN